MRIDDGQIRFQDGFGLCAGVCHGFSRSSLYFAPNRAQ
jgi:hypothetical protein